MVTRARDHYSVVHLDHPATWDDLEDVPEDLIGEVVAGELVLHPRPNVPHAAVASNLGVLVGGPFRIGVGGPGGWVILFEPRIRFGRDIRVPDLAGWRRERWVDLPREGPIPLVPDWICEVLSASTEAEDRTAKLPLYARAEVGHVWLISPSAATLEIYRRSPEGWLLVATHARPARLRAEPFDAVELDFTPLWEDLPPALVEEPED